MSLIGKLQRAFVYDRRVRRLAELLSQTIPASCIVLDVGSGDGKLAWTVLQRRPDLRIEGVDVLMRPQSWITMKSFDGTTLPYPDATFDAVMLIDVLHHTVDPVALLQEALRVSRGALIVKDHVLQGFLANARLRLMDYAGNADHRVALPYNYMSEPEWTKIEALLDLRIVTRINRLDLYGWPLDYFFGAGLHFLAIYQTPAVKQIPE
jgi:SAM-dependent methyltransferase